VTIPLCRANIYIVSNTLLQRTSTILPKYTISTALGHAMTATAYPAVAPAMAPVVDWTAGAARRLLSGFSQAINLALRRYYPSALRGCSLSMHRYPL